MFISNDTATEFSIVPEEEQSHFRLLELPAELLTIITSSNPPTLQLKSREVSGEDNAVVLCTRDQTYHLRQASTSNTVFIAGSFARLEEEDGQSRIGLQAISQSQSTLEVLPGKVASAATHITETLPAYTSTGFCSSKDAISKEELFANIPLSDVECELVWRDPACCELKGKGHSVVPSPSVRLSVWEALLGSATSMGIDLTQPLNARDQSAIINSGHRWPDELLMAVLRSMTASAAEETEMQLDDKVCPRNVGYVLLKDRTEGSKGAIPTSSFKNAWADLLPEGWRSLTDLNLLRDCYRLGAAGGEITYVEDAGADAATPTGVAPAETKSTLGAKRKWHDKFRASKRTS